MGCGCLLALIAAFTPRIALFFVWVFTPYVSRAYSSWIWPLLGIIFLPFTTLIYALLWTPGIGVTGWEWLWVILAVLLDLSAHGGGALSRAKNN
jgi:hypothetical protein